VQKKKKEIEKSNLEKLDILDAELLTIHPVNPSMLKASNSSKTTLY